MRALMFGHDTPPSHAGDRWPHRLFEQRLGASRRASAGLAVLLVILPSFALWGSVSTYRHGEAARHATALSDAFEEARYQVAAEESLERKYRLEPGAEVRQRHRDAAKAMVAALERAASQAAGENQAWIGDVIAKHVDYLGALDRLFAAVDAGDVGLTNRIDEEETDPLFDDIEARVVAAAAASRSIAEEQLVKLARLQTRVAIATPIVFSVGLGLVLFFLRVLRSYQAKAKDAAEREAQVAQRSEQRYRLLVQNSTDTVLICSADGTVTYQNPTAKTASSSAFGGLLDKSLFSLVHPDDQIAAKALLQQAQDAPEVPRQSEVRVGDGTGGWRYCELILTNLLHEPAVSGIVATIHDVDERKDFERQLIQKAFYDPLTGLPNRALFRDRLDQALARTGPHFDSVGVIFVDLDNFKLVNDSLGHQIGDTLLISAAKRLRNCSRKQDTVARLSGDEFVVLLENLTEEGDAARLVETILEQFARPFALDGREIVVTASVGVAIGGSTYSDGECLLRNADLAMYRAKAEGKARSVVFKASMHEDALARLELEADLRQALDGRQLYLQYQPVVSLGSGRMSEFEALVRWRHPTRGLIQPLEFIPIAEETGLIGPIGLWVLEEACRQAVDWQKQFATDPPLVMSVNLSPKQFQNGNLVETVAGVLAKTGLPPGCLKLEITEGLVMRDIEESIVTLNQLKGLGVQIAIDDFGTGYSSLAYLKRLPLDVLKIDRSFISGVGQNRQDNTIAQAILSLADSLGLTVTAEGIETADQATALEGWCCHRGQGFYFAKPLDQDAAATLLASSVEASANQSMVQAA